MKKIGFSVIVFFLVFLMLSCVTTSNKIDQVTAYENIKKQFQKLDSYECRDSLSKYLAGSSYTTVKLRAKKGFNYGTLEIHSPIRAWANVFVNGYRYRRYLSDPREIDYLLTFMQSFIQSETISTQRTTYTYW